MGIQSHWVTSLPAPVLVSSAGHLVISKRIALGLREQIALLNANNNNNNVLCITTNRTFNANAFERSFTTILDNVIRFQREHILSR